MTFTEAAAQVLRLVGKPLHYKEITDVAIEKDLLSHVGKSPEVTMGARLAALVKKSDKDNPLVRIKPGVFALREWDNAMIESGLQDRTPAIQLAKRMEKQRAEQGDNGEASMAERSQPAVSPLADSDAGVLGEDEKERAELAATASELFSAEEDDDEPIFGGEEEEEEDSEAAETGGPGARRRRRRRRRGGRGAERDDDDLPSYTVADAPVGGEDADVVVAESSEPREERSARNQGQQNQGQQNQGQQNQGQRTQGGGEELTGAMLADLAEAALGPFQRQGGAPLRQVAEAIQRRGRGGDVAQVQSAVIAAVRTDNLRRSLAGQRPRFRLGSGRLSLTEWLLDGEALRVERDLQSLAQRYRDAVRRSFLRRLAELPPRALSELVLMVLERLGYQNVKAVRRAGSHQSEQHFSARFSAGGGNGGDSTAAIVIRRDGRDLGRERVTELRGALHHYGPATSAVMVTTGQALGGAKEEAAAAGASPVRLIDGAALARLADEHGVGFSHSEIRLPLLDADLLDSLKNGG